VVSERASDIEKNVVLSLKQNVQFLFKQLNCEFHSLSSYKRNIITFHPIVWEQKLKI